MYQSLNENMTADDRNFGFVQRKDIGKSKKFANVGRSAGRSSSAGSEKGDVRKTMWRNSEIEMSPLRPQTPLARSSSRRPCAITKKTKRSFRPFIKECILFTAPSLKSRARVIKIEVAHEKKRGRCLSKLWGERAEGKLHVSLLNSLVKSQVAIKSNFQRKSSRTRN